MKRYLIRISVMSLVVALGIVAIAYAQRSLKPRESAEALAGGPPEQPPAVALDASSVPAPQPGAGDPFGVAAVQPPRQSEVAPVAYNEAPSYGETPTAGEPVDPNVLQVVAEAELSPTPNDPAAQPIPADPQVGFVEEPAPAAEPAAPYQAPPEQGYRPNRMRQSAEPSPQPTPAPDEIPDVGAAAADIPNAEAPAANEYQDQPSGEPSALPARAPATSFEEGTGRPGSRELEGSQGASLLVEKVAPPELQVGKSAVFQVKARNAGTVIVKDVQIVDFVPKGARLLSTTPNAEQAPTGELVWNVGKLKPGEESIVSMEIEPMMEGEIGSVATARFAADASARSVATRPQLTLQVAGPRDVLVGQEVRLQVKVANVGTGVATKVTLLNQLPDNFTHPAGREVEYTVGNLAPNESREIELALAAAKPGRIENAIIAQGEGNLHAEDQVVIDVLAPGLELAIDGAERRFLERQATYTLSLSNPGTAPAKNVELHVQLPEGVQFVEANNLGEFEARTRMVHWRLEELPAGESGDVKLVVLPQVEGEQKLAVLAKAAQGLNVQKEQRLAIEGIAGTSFEVVDVSDPIEAGGETTYEIRVVNQGTKAATNVRVVAVVPEGMKPIDADGPSTHLFEGGQVTFQPLARLAPKADTTYHIRVQAAQAGDMRLRVQLLSDEMRTPVTKEESTRVFGDE